jgi:hypothetical protein
MAFPTHDRTDGSADRHPLALGRPTSSVDSLNVPVPGRVRRIAADLHPELVAFDWVRERHGLLCKRFERTPDQVALRDALAGTPAFEAKVTGIDYFTDPPHGSAPVVYLAVESPGLRRLHERLA